MISPHVEAEIRRLLVETDFGFRAIAALTGVSRGTVGAINSGKRAARPERREEAEQPSGPPRRCPGCGGMVLMPCLLCAVRGARAGRRRAFPALRNNAATAVGLDLRPEHRQRYLQVSQWRRTHNGQPFLGADDE